LEKKGGKGISSVLKKTGKAKPLIFVFDVVYYKEKFISEKSLKKRREILKKNKLEVSFFLIKFKKFRI
jgi:ATP-dependent DNA ligase